MHINCRGNKTPSVLSRNHDWRSVAASLNRPHGGTKLRKSSTKQSEEMAFWQVRISVIKTWRLQPARNAWFPPENDQVIIERSALAISWTMRRLSWSRVEEVIIPASFARLLHDSAVSLPGKSAAQWPELWRSTGEGGLWNPTERLTVG